MPRAKPPLTLDRRQLLKAAAGFGGLVAGGSLPFAARALVPRTRIDVHAHLIPDFYRKAIDAYGVLDASGAALPDWSPTAAVNFMNKFGIQAQVLSLPEPGLAFIPELAERVRMATELNDYVRDELVYASSATPYRGRFGGFATLPLGDPRDPNDVAAARAEAIRALSTLQLDGVVLYTSYTGVYLGDSKLAPLMQTLNALKARVMVVPVVPPLAPPDPSGLPMPASVLELPFETTRVATNMLYKLVYLLYPNICWQFSEGGGTTPFLSFRSGLLALNLNPDVSSYAKLHFDTASATAPATVASMRKVTDVSHILLGTDYPYTAALYANKPEGDPNVELNDSFSPAERQCVDRGNALSQLPRLATRLALG